MEYKFVAILNKKIKSGKLMNALAHMSLGLLSKASDEIKEEMGFTEYLDADNNIHGDISKLSYIILKADNSNKIRKIRNQAVENNILFTDFTESMTGETYKEQLERTIKIREEDLEYYGICLFGEKEILNQLTKRFSLYK